MHGQAVEFSKENALKCKCVECRVQTRASCVQAKEAAIKAVMEDEGASLPDIQSDVPRVYCSQGFAQCEDLQLHGGTCICNTCEVFTENNCNQWWYCVRGPAARVDRDW